MDLNLSNFNSSDLFIDLEKISNDNYLNIIVFYITKSELRPENFE